MVTLPSLHYRWWGEFIFYFKYLHEFDIKNAKVLTLL